MNDYKISTPQVKATEFKNSYQIHFNKFTERIPKSPAMEQKATKHAMKGECENPQPTYASIRKHKKKWELQLN